MRNAIPTFLVPALLALAAGCGTDPTRARTEQGWVRGAATGVADSVAVFKGLPYAKPPVGARRWRAPEPPESWEGERDATAFGPACPQPRGDAGTAAYYRRAARRLGRDTTAVPTLGPTSEDCLTLNVWTPAGGARTGDGGLPVFVWVHGGGGVSGSGSDPLFDGRRLAARGMVVVTLNYRLGALGFLAHPALSADDPVGVSGNYALLDIVRALDWVRRNAPVFGGDPERVTLAGQSSGATLVEQLMVVPAARGLFQRVVSESATWVEAAPLHEAETAGARFMETLGLAADADAGGLRAVPTDSLLAGMVRSGRDAPTLPVVDGRVIPDRPARLWARGSAARVPVLKGSGDDEFALFMPPTDRAVVRRLSDRAFRAPTVLMLRWAEGRLPVWLYRFAWRPDGEDGNVGAFHDVELPFVFGTHTAIGWWDPSPDVERLTAAVQEAWVRFAARGDPGWDRAVPDTLRARILDVPLQGDTLRMGALPEGTRLQALADTLAAELGAAGGPPYIPIQ